VRLSREELDRLTFSHKCNILGSTFEWYGEYRPQLQPLLRKYIKPSSKVLNVGCGNSDLSADMYDDGFQNIVNVDFSEVVIEEMRRKNKVCR